jgi:dihydroflavonol-4-reductase
VIREAVIRLAAVSRRLVLSAISSDKLQRSPLFFVPVLEDGQNVSSIGKGDCVFLTGGSGFIGGRLLGRLLAAGVGVRALARPTSRRDHLVRAGVEIVEGDLRDRQSLRKGLAGCRYVFHVAADYHLWCQHRADTFACNVEGTRHVMEEALAAGVERIVYTSSVATLALRDDDEPADESRSLSPEQAIGAYKQSKVIAEDLVRRMAAERGLPAVIVNPSTPIGPGDWRPTPTGQIIVAAASGRIPGFVETGLNLAHVDDVAAGHLAALDRGKIGERYILGGEDVLFSQMLSDIAALVGRPAPTMRVPWYAALPIACASEAVALVTGREPLATLNGVRMSRHRMFFSNAKAIAQLGYRARPYREALRDALCWFGEHGYIARRVQPALESPPGRPRSDMPA